MCNSVHSALPEGLIRVDLFLMRSCDNCELGLIMDIIAASWIGFYPIKPSLNKDDDGGDDFVDNIGGDDCLRCGNH